MDNVLLSPLRIDELIDAIALRVSAILQERAGKDSNSQDDDVMDIEAAARFLGLTKTTLYSNKGIRRFKLKGGKKIYFSRKSLTEFIKASPMKTGAILRKEADEAVIRHIRKKP